MSAGFLAALGGAAGGVLNMIQNGIARNEYYNWERAKLQYNSIPNQLAQWKAAGLNPNSFNGSFVPQTGTPPQPFNIGNGIANAISNASNLFQSKEIAKMSNKVQLKNLDLQNKYYDIALGDATMRKAMHDITLKRAEQALKAGQIDMALSFMDLLYTVQTFGDRKDIVLADAKNAREFARRYPEYLGTKITHEAEQANSLRHGRGIADQRLVLDYNRLFQDDSHFYRREYDTNYHRNADRDLRRYSLDLNDLYRNNRLDFDEYKFGVNSRFKHQDYFFSKLNFGKKRYYLPSKTVF